MAILTGQKWAENAKLDRTLQSPAQRLPSPLSPPIVPREEGPMHKASPLLLHNSRPPPEPLPPSFSLRRRRLRRHCRRARELSVCLQPGAAEQKAVGARGRATMAGPAAPQSGSSGAEEGEAPEPARMTMEDARSGAGGKWAKRA